MPLRICLVALACLALLMVGSLLLERAYHYEQCQAGYYEDGSLKEVHCVDAR